MAPRAIWKGHLEIGQLVCPVALHAAASTSERVAFHIVNRKTGHRVRRVFVDAETGETVEGDDQAKGYETDRCWAGWTDHPGGSSLPDSSSRAASAAVAWTWPDAWWTGA